MATAFSTQGALTQGLAPGGLTFGGTPASKALSGAVGGAFPSYSATPTTIGGTQTTTPAVAPTSTAPKPVDFSQVATTSGLIPSSQTHTNTDGSSVTTKYAPPVQTDPLMSGVGAQTPDQLKAAGAPQDPTATTNPNTFPGYVGAAATAAQGNAAIGQNAANIASDYGKQIAQTGILGKAAMGGALTTGTTPVAEGNAAVIGQTTAAQQSALAAGESAALQGTGQQLTAQGQEQTGLLGAAGAVKPEGNFPFVFNPQTGSFSAPGAGGGTSNGGPTLTYNPQTDATSLAKSVMGRQISYQDAISALSYGSNGPNAAGQLSSAILAAGGNPTDLQAQATGQASVAGTIPALQSANTAAQGIAQTINSFLSQNPTINASPLAVGNLAQQWLQGKQLTDPAYQTFFNYLSEYANTLAPVLGVGGDPTNMKTQIAQAFLNPQASGQSTQQVLKAMGDLATQKIENLQSGASGGGVVASSPASSSTGTSGSSVSGFGWNG